MHARMHDAREPSARARGVGVRDGMVRRWRGHGGHVRGRREPIAHLPPHGLIRDDRDRGDRLVGQFLGAVGTLPPVHERVEISFHLLRHLLGIDVDGPEPSTAMGATAAAAAKKTGRKKPAKGGSPGKGKGGSPGKGGKGGKGKGGGTGQMGRR